MRQGSALGAIRLARRAAGRLPAHRKLLRRRQPMEGDCAAVRPRRWRRFVIFRFDRGAPCGQEKGQLTGSASACLVDENKAEKKKREDCFGRSRQLGPGVARSRAALRQRAGFPRLLEGPSPPQLRSLVGEWRRSARSVPSQNLGLEARDRLVGFGLRPAKAPRRWRLSCRAVLSRFLEGGFFLSQSQRRQTEGGSGSGRLTTCGNWAAADKESNHTAYAGGERATTQGRRRFVQGETVD